jgi:adenosylhomocysteine nucleosidase
MRIGIIGAMESEVRDLLEEMRDVTSVERADRAFHSGTLRGADVVVASSGVGKVNAAVCTQLMITHYAPDCIVNSGIAGNLSPTGAIGDVIVSTKLAYHDIRGLPRDSFWPYMAYFEADRALVDRMLAACAASGIERCRPGVIATGDVFLDDSVEKKRIRDEFQAECVEMEGAAIAHACFLNRVPFVVVRTVSDDADEGSPADFAAFEERTARVSAGIVAEFARMTAALS